MSASNQSQPPADPGRRSQQIALVLLGTMGVVGGAVVWDAWRRAQPDTPAATEQPGVPSPPVAADRDYQNNDFTPGVGYYHAPYRSWFPFPFNHHDPSRGFFGGGLWQAAPFAAGLLSSRPTGDAVSSALAAQQRRPPEQSARAGTSGFGGARNASSSFGGSSFSSQARPSPATTNRPAATPTKGPAATPSTRPASSPAPSPSKPSIQRGGFGSSGKSSGGSSGS
jgi:hypothetical protein